VVACVLGALVLAVAGCGAETHVNDPRSQAPTRISVVINDETVTVQPTAIGLGPERTQQIPQNQHSAQPPIRTDAPLIAVFVASNQTGLDSHLEIHGPKEASSGPLFANSTLTMQAALPAGRYTVSAAGVPSAKPAKLTVGPYRASSQNDVLLP
jgi:hypothetical protein